MYTSIKIPFNNNFLPHRTSYTNIKKKYLQEKLFYSNNNWYESTTLCFLDQQKFCWIQKRFIKSSYEYFKSSFELLTFDSNNLNRKRKFLSFWSVLSCVWCETPNEIRLVASKFVYLQAYNIFLHLILSNRKFVFFL